jgi:DNA polymerase I
MSASRSSSCAAPAKQISFDKVPLEEATEYAAEDADITLRLWLRLKPRLAAGARRPGCTRWSTGRWSPPVIGKDGARGVKVDRDYLARLSASSTEEIAALEERIYEAAWVRSPSAAAAAGRGAVRPAGPQRRAQGQERAIFDRRQRARAARRRGRRSGPAGARLAPAVEAQEHLYRRAAGPDQPETGRVHTSYSLSARRPGGSPRPTQPAEHPDPHRDRPPDPRRLRRRARQRAAEPPTTARSSCGSPRTWPTCRSSRKAFAAGEDIHALTAQELFGTVDRDTRARAKTVNFAILYGISRWGLAGRLGIEADEAQAIIDRYFERFPGIRAYIDETLESVREHGFTRTLFGRKTHFPRIKAPTPGRAPGRRARGDQRADPGHQRRHHQAGDGADGPALEEPAWPTSDAAAGARRTGVRSARREGGEGRAGHPRVMSSAAEPACRSTFRWTSRSAGARNWGAAH